MRCRIFALVEFRDYVLARDPDPEDVAVLDQRLDSMRAVRPDLVDQVEALRKGELGGSRFYWTGLGPTALAREVQKTVDPGHKLADHYKFE